MARAREELERLRATLEAQDRELARMRRFTESVKAVAGEIGLRTGRAFFASLTLDLARVLRAELVFVGRLVPEQPTLVQTLAVARHGRAADEFTYALAGTPCATLVGTAPCTYPRGVTELFPEDAELTRMGAVAYAGVPLHDSRGRALGHIAAVFAHDLDDRELAESVMLYFASRTAAEIERLDIEAERRRLESEVAARTATATRAARALRESEARYRALFETMAQGVVYQSPSGDVVAANPAAERILGLTRDQLLGRSSMDPQWRAVHADGSSLPGDEHPAMIALRTGQAVRNVVMGVFNPREGGYRWLLVSATPEFRRGELHPFRAYATFDDITALVLAEVGRRESESKFRNIVESSPMGIHTYRLERDGRLVFTGGNRAAVTLLGFDHGELVGRPLEEAFPAHVGTEVPARYRRACALGERWSAEQIDYADDRVRGAFEVHAFQTTPGEMAVMFLETTQRRRAADALRASEARYRALFESSTEAILVIDDRGLVECNPRALEIFGRTVDELRGLGVLDISPPTQPDGRGTREAARDIRARTAAGGSVTCEWAFRRRDGTTFPAEATLTRVALAEKPFLLAVVRDLTERRRAEAERQALELQLRNQQKLESIGTLAAGVAHEINNPLNGILNYAQLIVNRLEETHALRRYAQRIVEESGRVSFIVRNLLAFSRQERQSHSPARLADIVDATLALLGAALRKDQIVLRADIPADLPTVRCRSQQIQQILMNLILNARDALNERYPTFDDDKRVTIRALRIERDGAAWLRTTVEDHGGGIPPEVASRVFDPFFTTKPRDRGTGLGLAVSYGLAKDHGGALWLESAPGEWTRFHLDLPVDNGWRLEEA